MKRRAFFRRMAAAAMAGMLGSRLASDTRVEWGEVSTDVGWNSLATTGTALYCCVYYDNGPVLAEWDLGSTSVSEGDTVELDFGSSLFTLGDA